jgi:8-hydroxy-5-deazaflavin:NADPH oxidoreductase
MNIGILGSGHIGATTAKLFVQAGHHVAISNTRGPASLSSLIAELGDNAQAVTDEDAVRYSEMILIAIPWVKRDTLPNPRLFEGKITIDATNPYDNNGIVDLGDSTSSEEVLKVIPGARLVKAFNTIYYGHLASEGRPGSPENDRHVIFIAGDDSEAKASVARLIDEIGFAAADTGFLREGGRLQQPGSPIYNKPMKLEQASTLLADLK